MVGWSNVHQSSLDPLLATNRSRRQCPPFFGWMREKQRRGGGPEGREGGHSDTTMMASVSAREASKFPAKYATRRPSQARKRAVARHVVPKEVLQAYLNDGIDDGKVDLEDLQRALKAMEMDGILKGNGTTVETSRVGGSNRSPDVSHRMARAIANMGKTKSEPREQKRIWATIGVLLITFSMGITGTLIERLGQTTSLGSVPFIVGSYGTLTTLFFCAPSSPLIRPWNLVAGHLLCCTVAVLCIKALPMHLAAMGIAEVHIMTIIRSVAMAISTFLMLKFDAVHPPGGALIYILCDTPSLQEFGWSFILYPGLTGATILVALVAMYMKAVQSTSMVRKESHLPAMPI